MAITRKKKEEIVAKTKEIFAKAKTVVFVGFKGLTVAEAQEMRRGLKAHGVSYTVAKKSLVRRALQGAKIEGAVPELPGEIALSYGEDELAPAREVATFMKKFGSHLSFVGGIFSGHFVDKVKITRIASIPGIEVLRAQFVYAINSPLQRFALILNAKAEKQN